MKPLSDNSFPQDTLWEAGSWVEDLVGPADDVIFSPNGHVTFRVDDVLRGLRQRFHVIRGHTWDQARERA
jgi:hypothetical protein